MLPIALNQRAGLYLHQGDFAAAASLIDEAAAITEATGSQLPLYAPLGLAAFRGQEQQASSLIRTGTRREAGVGQTLLHWATAVLDNGLGRYQDALAAAQRAVEDQYELVFSTWATVELIEAAARSGVPGRHAAPLGAWTPPAPAARTGRSTPRRARGRYSPGARAPERL